METLFLTHPTCRLHDMGQAHPECPERLDAISDQLLSSGIINYIQTDEVTNPASDEHLLRVHAPAHLERLAGWLPTEGVYDIDGDTLMNPHTLDAARHAAGGVIQAVDAVMAGQASNAFCAVRPPGHHASAARSMGFCFFNNIAVGIAHALANHGLSRVAIVDFDVHHGNGTEAIFAGDDRVLMCSYFQYPLFPGRRGEKLTRAGISYILGKYAKMARAQDASLIPPRLSPHCLRHSKAMHLLQSGVNLVYIRDLLGHVSVQTTEIYARTDSRKKREAIEQAYNDVSPEVKPQWEGNHDMIEWLRTFNH